MGLNVQGHVEDDDQGGHAFEAITCTACGECIWSIRKPASSWAREIKYRARLQIQCPQVGMELSMEYFLDAVIVILILSVLAVAWFVWLATLVNRILDAALCNS